MLFMQSEIVQVKETARQKCMRHYHYWTTMNNTEDGWSLLDEAKGHAELLITF